MNENIVAYIGTIWNDIQGLEEDEIRDLIKEDIKMMDEEAAAYTMEHLEEIVAEALEELSEEEKTMSENKFQDACDRLAKMQLSKGARYLIETSDQGAIEDNWSKCETSEDVETMAREIISAEAAEEGAALLADHEIRYIAEWMDDEIREDVHGDLAPCTDQEFMAEYEIRHFLEHGEYLTVC